MNTHGTHLVSHLVRASLSGIVSYAANIPRRRLKRYQGMSSNTTGCKASLGKAHSSVVTSGVNAEDDVEEYVWGAWVGIKITLKCVRFGGGVVRGELAHLPDYGWVFVTSHCCHTKNHTCNSFHSLIINN